MALKTVRIIANANLKHLRTVNVVNVPAASAKPHLQAAGANPTFGTVQASAALTPGLPTIFVSGYSGPA